MSLNLPNVNYFLIKINKKKIYKKLIIKKNNLKKTVLNFKNKFNYYFIKFIINVTFKKSNIFIHIMDCLGNEKYFYSIKKLSKKLKNFKFNNQLEQFYKILITQFKFLKNNPLSIHFNYTEFNYKWFIEKITQKFIVIIIKFYNKYSHNGCRKKKIRRKKKKKWLSLV